MRDTGSTLLHLVSVHHAHCTVLRHENGQISRMLWIRMGRFVRGRGGWEKKNGEKRIGGVRKKATGKRLLLNHSPVSGHVKSLLYSCSPCALISDPNPNPNLNPNQYSESYHNPNPIPNPNPTEKLSLLSRLAEHWSRDHIKIGFSPITPQGCIFTLRRAG